MNASLNVMLSVVTAPTWSHRAGGVDGPPDNPNALASFMAQLVSRYRGRVRA